MLKFLSSTYYTAAVVAVAAALIYSRLQRVVVEIPVEDRGMRPAIGSAKTHFTVDTTWVEAPQRGSIIAFIPPGGNADEHKAARVVGIAGDRVEIRGHRLYVGGAVPEGFKGGIPAGNPLSFVVPRDCAYVLCDSPSGKDSLDFGPLPLGRVAGSLVLE